MGNTKKYLKMDSEDEEVTDEESDDYDIYKPQKIIKFDEKYEVENGLLGLKRDIILKLTTPIIGEYEMKKLFSIGKEMCAIKNTPHFKRLRYFPPILQIRYGQPQPGYNDDGIRCSRLFVSKEFMTEFFIYYKMYKDTGICRLKSICYSCLFYSLGIGLIEYVNGIYNFMTDNH
jgi:hypothetical protein